MAEQEQRLALTVELGHEVITLVQPHACTERLELDAHPVGDLADARRVARRLELHELAQQVDQRVGGHEGLG